MDQLRLAKASKILSNRPEILVTRYTGCVINRISIGEKTNMKGTNIDFFGVLTDIIEVSNLGQSRVVIFNCDWWDLSVEANNDDILCRNDMDMIYINVNVEDHNKVIDNFVDDDSAAKNASLSYEGNKEDYISSNDESDCDEDYISSNNESDDT
ncbi:hypothetical protein ACOSQ3_021248 [Xanthoceras sorbifolium]